MARIGTWKKIDTHRNDSFVYVDKDGKKILIFLASEYSARNLGVNRYWGVEVQPLMGEAKYLAGGNSGIFNATKTKAFRIARNYMREHS